MYKIKNNIGLYFELLLLIDYIEDNNELNTLNNILIAFKKTGLDNNTLRISIELINKYLPSFIECNSNGCYLNQKIDNIDSYTCFSDIETDNYFSNIQKKSILV